MSKDKDLLSRFGANLAESMGAGRLIKNGGGSPAPSPDSASKHDGVTRLRAAAEIEVGRIVPDPDQPRTEFDHEAIRRLAESLKSHGQLQPISVRWSDSMGRYLIVTGERRWRASIEAKRPTIAAVILEGERIESQVLELQLIENCLREDLQPIEQARAFRTLMDRNGWSATRLAEALQLTGASVTRALALLDLPYTVQNAVASGELAPSVAYEISKVEDPTAQEEVASRVVSEGLSRAATIEAVRKASKQSRGGKKPAKRSDPAERTLRTSAGVKVVATHKKGLSLEAWIEALEEATLLARSKREASEDQAAA
jgi:ParB family chromosome partitioning protein